VLFRRTGNATLNRGRSEFCRLVPLARLGPEPFHQEIAATEEERAALARRFDLVAIDRLTATVELARQGKDLVLLRAGFEAGFVQNCVVSLDPVPGAVSERFSLLYGPPEAEESAAGFGEDVAFEPLSVDAIDIGEAVAQEFSLALPPFPRRAEAIIEAEEPGRAEKNPFAALSRLSEREWPE
jgi:uncharacterized metal-binding protein YceD (DUF177 family)